MTHDILDDDNTIGAEDVLTPESDEMDFAEHVKRLNPTADQLQHFAQMRGLKQQQLSAVAPFARTNPPSVLTGSLGNQVVAVTGKLIQVANWSGDDAETGPVTITLAPTQMVASQPVGLRPLAIVQFGTRGSLVTAEVDIGLGTQFTISGSQVTVQVGLDTDPSGVIDTMILCGMLSFHPIVRTAPVLRTRYLDSILAAAGPNIMVPPFAKNLSLWRAAAATPVQIRFLDYNGVIVYIFDLAAGAYMFDPIPLSGDIAFISLNKTGGGDTSGRLIFELGI